MRRGRPIAPLSLAVAERASLERWLLRHPQFHPHFTPTGASWLNLVERWFAALTEKQLRRGVHRSTREPEAAIRGYLDLNDRHPKPFICTTTADQILASVARSCTRIADSGLQQVMVRWRGFTEASFGDIGAETGTGGLSRCRC